MTKHLYYEDSYLTEFSARVLDKFQTGGKPAIVLDQTAFYPTSGGQPCDYGLLAGASVESVEEDDVGRIIHILGSVPSGGEVCGKIDWARRFDHMQQHTGQHILSQAFMRVSQAATLSFHLGQEISTIDIDLPQPDSSVLRAAEDLAALVIFEDRQVRVLNVTRDDLSSLGVRKESHREGQIRVIDIEGFDRSPCGGTHVRRCGEVGMIFILGGERYKGGTRVEFVCGGRALRAFRGDHDVLRDLARLHSAHPIELTRLTEKLMQERSALARDKKHLEDQVLEMEAQELRASADKIGGVVAVRRSYEDRKLESLKTLAQKVTSLPGTLAILCGVHDTAQLVVARSANVPGDCGAAVKRLTGKLGGKGGGRPELAQAGGIAPSSVEEWSQALVDYFRTCWDEQDDPLRKTD